MVIVAILVGVLATRPAAGDRTFSNPLVGSAAPPIDGTALDGRKISLADLEGRAVVVNFFATWCVPCRQEHPELVRFTESHTGANSPAVIAVAYDRNDIGATRNFFAKEGGAWPVVPDDGGRIAIAYGVRGLPESFIVDVNGNISARVTGKVTLDSLNALTGSI